MQKGTRFLYALLAAVMAMGALNAVALAGQAEPRARSGAESGVALMFNVYQDTESVASILDILDQYGVRASFFIGGVWAKDNEETVRRIFADGHDVGNHGYSHKLPTKAGEQTTREEIRRTDEILARQTGEKPILYAPPSGDFDQRTVQIAAEEGYQTILWSADTIDWRDKNAGIILERALTRLKDGGFLLMHPTPATVQALPGIIEGLTEKRLEIRRVSELLGIAEPDSGLPEFVVDSSQGD